MEKTRSLISVEDGALVEIVGLLGGWGARRRLWDLGLKPGAKFKVITGGPFGGPLLLECLSTGHAVSLGRGLAFRVSVRRISNE